MWHDIRRLLELYDQLGEVDMALAEASDRLGRSDAREEGAAETDGRPARAPGVVIPFPRRPERS